jgi:DNA-binding beta-propeller fold protein YncE
MLSMNSVSKTAIYAACGLFLALSYAGAQVHMVEGELFVADRGNSANGSDGEIRRYSHNGAFRSTIVAGGTGVIRGCTFDQAGNLYVARGNNVIRHAAPTYAPDPGAFASGTKAQDVAVNRATQNIWVSWGTNANEAEITEHTPSGTLVQTITNAALIHPRSIAFDFAGGLLYVANGAGNNVLLVNPGTAAVSIYRNLSVTSGMMTLGFDAIGVTVDLAGNVFVVGDYGLQPQIVKLSGVPGSVTQSTYLIYSTGTGTGGFRAPSGAYADAHGNLYFACRSQNNATAGVYPLSAAAPLPVLPPFTGTEQTNPIDIAFKPEPLTISFVSPGGVDTVGIAQVTITPTPPAPIVTIHIDAPNFPSRPYGLLMSVSPSSVVAQCLGGQVTVPNPLVSSPLTVGEPRLIPLSLDLLFAQSLAAAAAGSGPIALTGCNFGPVMSIPGVAFQFNGLTDNTGRGTAQFQLPTAPCIGPGANFYLSIAGAVVDGMTAPLGIAVLSDTPTCLRVRT